MALNMTDYEPPDFYEFEVSPDLHIPSTHSLSIKVLKDPQIPIEHLKAALVAAAVFSLIVLIAKDAHKAFMRRAHWIPCDFLVLSAFSIQMLNMLNTQNQALAGSSQTEHWLSIKAEGNSAGQYARWKDFLMIHNSRTILCVFTAYVLPSMADRGLEHSWVRWVALVITVFHHVTSEFYSVKDKSKGQGGKDSTGIPNVLRLWPGSNGERNTIYYLYATVISACFILLIFLLACATIAGRSIERIVAQKIRLVLRGEGEFCATGSIAEKTQEVHPHPQPHHHSCWRNVKIDINRVDQHYHLHHVHVHSCLQTVEEAVLRAGKGDENHHHSCRRTLEDAVLRVEKEAEIHHSCRQTIEEAAVRGEKAEEEHYRRHCHYCWRTVEDAVLKAWIILRAYSVQPVLARSALSASAAVIVTIQIVITIVGGLSKVLKKDNQSENNKFKLVAIIVQSIFILMAWALINLRWATAVAYHRRAESDTWHSGFKVEDFWTRHLKELEQEGSSLEEAQSLDKEIDKLVSKKKTTTAPSILLYSAIALQLFLVSFSKACWLVSLKIFHNKLMGKLFSFMFEKHIMCVFEDYPKYEKILQDIQMLGESPESLWVANRKSIKQAKTLIIQGNEDGEYNCEDLVQFLIEKRTAKDLGLSCLEPYKPQTELKFLCKKRPIQRTQQPQEENDVEKQQSRGREKDLLTGEEQFTDVSTKSWKMKAVSLLSIIFHLCPIYADVDKEHCSTSHAFPPKAVKDCFKAYSQAWEIIDFVEEAYTEADGITSEADKVTSEAADKDFKLLQKKVDEEKLPERNFMHATPACVRRALMNLKEESKSKTEPRKKGKKQGCPQGWEGNDSIDWKTSASGSAVYNLCDSIECNDETDVSELLKELESYLADIINECLEKTQHLLLLKSRKWALNRDEKRMGKALYATGKAKAIMEKLASNKLAIVSYH